MEGEKLMALALRCFQCLWKLMALALRCFQFLWIYHEAIRAEPSAKRVTVFWEDSYGKFVQSFSRFSHNSSFQFGCSELCLPSASNARPGSEMFPGLRQGCIHASQTGCSGGGGPLAYSSSDTRPCSWTLNLASEDTQRSCDLPGTSLQLTACVVFYFCILQFLHFTVHCI